MIPHADLFRNLERGRVWSGKGILDVINGLLSALHVQHDPEGMAGTAGPTRKLVSVIEFIPLIVPMDGKPAGFIFTSVLAGRGA